MLAVLSDGRAGKLVMPRGGVFIVRSAHMCRCTRNHHDCRERERELSRTTSNEKCLSQ